MRPALLGLLSVLSGCCFDPSVLSAPVVGRGGAGTPPPVATGGPRMPGGPGSAIFGRVTVAATGLTTDPTIVAGVAGGPMMLSTLGSSCLGHAGPTPSHHVTLEGEAPRRLRLMAFPPGGQDLTLAVRGPDGGMYCNDDSDGLSPMIEETLAPGEYDVWVGTYGAGMGGVPYDFGVTANLSVTPSLLRAPPPPPPPGPVDPITGLPIEPMPPDPWVGLPAPPPPG